MRAEFLLGSGRHPVGKDPRFEDAQKLCGTSQQLGRLAGVDAFRLYWLGRGLVGAKSRSWQAFALHDDGFNNCRGRR